MFLTVLVVFLAVLVALFPVVAVLIPNWTPRIIQSGESFTLVKGQKVSVASGGDLKITAWSRSLFRIVSERGFIEAEKFADSLYLYTGMVIGQILELEGAEEAHIDILAPVNSRLVINPSRFQKIATAVVSGLWIIIWGFMAYGLTSVKF